MPRRPSRPQPRPWTARCDDARKRLQVTSFGVERLLELGRLIARDSTYCKREWASCGNRGSSSDSAVSSRAACKLSSELRPVMRRDTLTNASRSAPTAYWPQTELGNKSEAYVTTIPVSNERRRAFVPLPALSWIAPLHLGLIRWGEVAHPLSDLRQRRSSKRFTAT